jgi:hypothetical protein
MTVLRFALKVCVWTGVLILLVAAAIIRAMVRCTVAVG